MFVLSLFKLVNVEMASWKIDAANKDCIYTIISRMSLSYMYNLYIYMQTLLHSIKDKFKAQNGGLFEKKWDTRSSAMPILVLELIFEFVTSDFFNDNIVLQSIFPSKLAWLWYACPLFRNGSQIFESINFRKFIRTLAYFRPAIEKKTPDDAINSRLAKLRGWPYTIIC